jgi:hypothetical protein
MFQAVVFGMANKNDKEEKKAIVGSVIEGRKLDSYAEHQTREMHACFMCDDICYKKKPTRQVGKRWICIDCLRQLKETLDQLKQWEEEVHLKDHLEKQLDEGLGLDGKKGSEEE